MSRTAITSLLAILSLVCIVGRRADAQDLKGFGKLQLFAPDNLSTYGNAPRPNEGLFFSFEQLFWTISRPDTTPIGAPGKTRVVYYDTTTSAVQQNDYDTGFLRSSDTHGQRYEFGCVDGHHGWMCSVTDLASQATHVTVRDADVVFDDRDFALGKSWLQGDVGGGAGTRENLPVTFESMDIGNEVNTWGVELNYVRRLHPCHYGGNLEFFGGVRYTEFDEQFDVHGYGGILDRTDLETLADNHIVGPQFGVRYFRRFCRWTFSTEGRFFAGFNYQGIRQRGIVGSELTPPGGQDEPTELGPTSFHHNHFVTEWAPGVELRLNAAWHWTKNVAIKAGWTGVYMDGIARASRMNNWVIDAQGDVMGIKTTDNRRGIFMNGFTIGVEINR